MKNCSHNDYIVLLNIINIFYRTFWNLKLLKIYIKYYLLSYFFESFDSATSVGLGLTLIILVLIILNAVLLTIYAPKCIKR